MQGLQVLLQVLVATLGCRKAGLKFGYENCTSFAEDLGKGTFFLLKSHMQCGWNYWYWERENVLNFFLVLEELKVSFNEELCVLSKVEKKLLRQTVIIQ